MAHGTTTERVKLLLKPGARASRVALGKAVERVCVCVFKYIVLISSGEISVTTVAAIFNFKYTGHIFLSAHEHDLQYVHTGEAPHQHVWSLRI